MTVDPDSKGCSLKNRLTLNKYFMKNYVIGIDYGTDSVRALIVDAGDGSEAAAAVRKYPRWAAGKYCDAAANRYRQHPLDYIEAMVEAVREAVSSLPENAADNIKGICFDTTGSTPAITDAEGTPLALLPGFADNPNAMFMLWKDHTAIAEAEEITSLAKRAETDYTMYEGGTYSSEWAWAKVLHILRTDPEIAKAAYSWVEHCDWMPALLTGNRKAETVLRSRCAAGHKGMWHGSWGLPSEDFLGKLDPAIAQMRSRLFSETYTTDTKAGELTSEWAKKLGLRAGTAVAVGAIDAHLGAVGGCIEPYVLTRIIGTSTCDIMIIGNGVAGDKCIEGICGQVDGSVVPGYTGIEAGQSAFGDIYAWFRDILAWPLKNLMPGSIDIDRTIDEIIPGLSKEAEKIEPSESGPIALDWMNGRRTPFADQNLKGVIAGLSLGNTAPMIFRALVEATAFGSRAIVEHLKESNIEIRCINALGGISKKSPFVMQVLADVLGMPIRVVRSEQACALGSAMFAAVAAGIYPDIFAAQKNMGSGFDTEYRPDMERHQTYERIYGRYVKLAKTFDRPKK